MNKKLKVIVIGGGAAGFFGAINLKEANPDFEVILIEKTKQVLSKVKISGGGRCNVTHSCFHVPTLVTHYPRGEKALRAAFSRFQPKETIDWFLKRGVILKKEADGRMFPVTDNSETIIHCFMKSAKEAGVILKLESALLKLEKIEETFSLTLSTGEVLTCDKVLMATGSNGKIFQLIETLGHKIIPPLPSLFTFNIPESPLSELSGVAVPKAHLKIAKTGLEQTGPLLITHFGFSGPAVLKLSAWGARILADLKYEADLHINWLPDFTHERLRDFLVRFKELKNGSLMTSDSPVDLPKNLWKKLISFITDNKENLKWSTVSLKEINQIVEKLKKDTYRIRGKTTFKEEFVTSGGVDLREIDFRTMESKLVKGLYFAGEVIDVDGVTGGFNFQNGWTTSWIAAKSIAI